MKKTRTTKTPAPKPSALAELASFGKVIKEEDESGRTVPGFHPYTQDPKERRIFWHRAAAVQAAYDNAPAGADAIAAAVLRKILSYRPKLSASEMSDLISARFRPDVANCLYQAVAKVREGENAAIQAADDARRAKRQGKGVTRG